MIHTVRGFWIVNEAEVDILLKLHSFLNLEPISYSMSGSNCCFLTCIQVSQERDKVVWYSDLFKNFPQFAVIHTVKGFSIIKEADVFLKFPCFLYDPTNVSSSSFSKSSLYIWKFSVNVPLKTSVIYFSCWIVFHGMVVPPFGLLFSKTCQIFLLCCSGTLMVCLPFQAWFPCFFLVQFHWGRLCSVTSLK